MFKVGDRVEQTVDLVISKTGWLGEVKEVDGNYVAVKFDKHDKVLFVNIKQVKGANTMATDKKFQELIATANKGAAALRELVAKYPTKIHYNSPKFKAGKDHLCEKGGRLLEFDLVAKDVKVVKFDTLRLGNGITAALADAEEGLIAFDGEEFEAQELYQAFKSMLEGGGETMGFAPTRKGIECDTGLIAWDQAEILVNSLKASGLITA